MKGELACRRTRSVEIPGRLAVDDDAFVRELLATYLQQAGFQPTAVADGVAALEAVERDRFAAVVLDVEMPVMSGIDVARRLRRLPIARRSAIVMHTSIDEPIVRVDFTDYDAFLPKPCNSVRFAELVKEAIERRGRLYLTQPAQLPSLEGRQAAPGHGLSEGLPRSP